VVVGGGGAIVGEGGLAAGAARAAEVVAANSAEARRAAMEVRLCRIMLAWMRGVRGGVWGSAAAEVETPSRELRRVERAGGASTSG